ncbi:MAG TPA: hypothetical protein VKM37_04575 [Balneolaceae bacterium]|nr:hypothetical protein [Balneolaceae bacterium]
MSKIEDRCIAYIYNEMDPAERLEFERELQKDEDLLIELETLRRTAGCLNGLRCIEPPEFVVNSVKNKAESTTIKKTDAGSYRYLFASAAITLFAVMVYGAVIIQDQQRPGSADSNSTGNSEASLSTAGNISSVAAGTAGEMEEISPWVDHDEVIHFHERFNRGSVASVDSMFNHSLKKLTRVNSSRTVQQVQQQIHLTGGNR